MHQPLVLGLYGPRALGGGLADFVVLKEYQAIPLEDLSDEQGALVEPAAVAINAVIEAGVGPGHIALVVGAGSIGSLVILAAQAAGAAVVLASEPNPGRADYARRFGAQVIESGSVDDQVAQLRKLTGPRYPVDVAFDCAGRDGAMELCIGAIKPGGRICMVAGRKNGPPIDVTQLQQLPASIVGSLAYTACLGPDDRADKGGQISRGPHHFLAHWAQENHRGRIRGAARSSRPRVEDPRIRRRRLGLAMAYSKNIERIGYNDLQGKAGFKLAMNETSLSRSEAPDMG